MPKPQQPPRKAPTLHPGQVRVHTRKHAPTIVTDPATGARSYDFGPLQAVDVVLEVDLDGLLALVGGRAANSKSGRATLADGLVVARVTKRHPAPKPDPIPSTGTEG